MFLFWVCKYCANFTEIGQQIKVFGKIWVGLLISKDRQKFKTNLSAMKEMDFGGIIIMGHHNKENEL